MEVARPVRCVCTRGGETHGYFARVAEPKGVPAGFVGSVGPTFESTRDVTLARLDLIWQEGQARRRGGHAGASKAIVDLLTNYMRKQV